jgi:putative ABC transport system permease protein
MWNLAARMLARHRGSAAATLIALAAGVAILMTMGVLVASGLAYHLPPHPTLTITSTDIGGDPTTSTVALPEGGSGAGQAAVAARDLLIQAGGAFGGYVVLLIVFVVASTVGLSVRHRRRDLALLRAVGATPAQVRRTIVAEAGLLGLAAAVPGVPAGLLATAWVHRELIHRGFLPAGFPMAGPALPALAAILLTTLVAMLAALIAARRATAIRPAEALGETAVEPAGPGRVRLIGGLIAVAGTVVSAVIGAGGGGTAALTGAVGMLYLAVTAVALLAPWINRLAARALAPLLRTLWGAGGYLAAANLRANARGSATVLTALVLSVGFGGSVWFLQDNLQRATVEQSRSGLLADRALVAPGGLPADAVTAARAVPGVRAATGVRHTSVVVTFLGDGEVVPAQAIDVPGAAATMDLGIRAGRLADLRGDTVAVSRQRADTQGWRLGQRVRFWLGDGTPVAARVVAIYDRGLGFGDVTLPRAAVAGHTTTAGDDQILISTTPSAATDAALARLAARYPGARLVPGAALTGAVSYDLAVSAWLNKLLIAVMIGYAALAAANTMVIAALARAREVALLRLAGGTRRQIKRMVQAEQAGLLGTALVIGGLIAAATLSTAVHALTGDPVPWVPAAGGATVLAGTAVLALATTILPIGRLLRRPVVETIGIRE